MSDYRVYLDGAPAGADLYAALSTLEVEENADLPDALRAVLTLAPGSADPTWVGDGRLKPFTNVAVVVTTDDGRRDCIFDGYLLAHRAHLEAGITSSTLEVWGQDASVLMTLEDKVREWSGMTEGEVANQIFSDYGFTPAAANTADDSPAHTDDGHTLMQRATDAEFLRRLARRSGRWFRVSCNDEPGQRAGFFAAPDLSGQPVATIDLNDPAMSATPSLEFAWDVARPSKVTARQASLVEAHAEGTGAVATDSGLPALETRGLRDFAGRDVSMLLTSCVDEADLRVRARAALRDAGWFARCEGTVDLAALKRVVRVGALVAVAGVGDLHSGTYLAQTVRHTITADAHTMGLHLVRNAVGPAPSGATTGPGAAATGAGAAGAAGGGF